MSPKLIAWMLRCLVPSLMTIFMAQPVVAQFQEQSVVNMYIYQGMGRAAFEKDLKAAVDAKLGMIENSCGMDTAARRKLQFAAKGDLARFMHQVDDLEEATKDLNVQDQADMQKAWDTVQPLYQKAQNKDILDDSSLFIKLLPKLLTAEQRESYEAFKLRRAELRREAVVRCTIVEMENSMPLLAKQRTALYQLLMKSKRLKNVPQGYEPFIGYIHLCKAAEAELEEIFDEEQMVVIGQFRERYRGYVGAN